MKAISLITSLMALAATIACGGNNARQATPPTAEPEPDNYPTAAVFDADRAYAYVADQVAFGPRVPGSEASAKCKQWLVETLDSLGAVNIIEQRAKVTAYDGTPLDICNISAQVNPDARRRVLLLAHYDSRPWADQEADPAKRNTPIDGANDGASGVGVILEIVRQLGIKPASIGVDVLLVDAEDYGRRSDQPQDDPNEQSWCLGTQYWSKYPTVDTQAISYAILLDMVGGKDAVFQREYFSQQYAPHINDKVWNIAAKSGYANRFVEYEGIPVLDDHIYLLRAGIPAIDIIETGIGHESNFNPTWHTHADNIANIDPATLGAVGQVVLNVIYAE